MDEVFGEDNFKREIIWTLKGVSGYKSLVNNWVRGHDTIYFYSKNDELFFEKQYLQYNEKQLKRFKKDENGRMYKPITKERGIFLDEAKGTPIPDVWDDIASFQTIVNSPEIVDYSTQKPEALLERIIKSSSNKDMVIADFFGGSGVTAKVANDLGRRFIHTDIGVNSIQTVRDRLKEAGAEFQIMEIKDGVNLFRNPVQTMDKMATLIPGLQKGIDGVSKFWFGAILDSKQGTVPVYVPNLIDSKEKVLDIPLINKIVNQELQNLEISAKKVIVYYIDIIDYKEIEQFIKDNNATEIKVELKDIKNLLHDIVV
jgi:adenine-specific DNA-methyltransferase